MRPSSRRISTVMRCIPLLASTAPRGAMESNTNFNRAGMGASIVPVGGRRDHSTVPHGAAPGGRSCIARRSRGGCGGRGEGRRWPRSTTSCSRSRPSPTSPGSSSRQVAARRGASIAYRPVQLPAHPCRGRHAAGEGPALRRSRSTGCRSIARAGARQRHADQPPRRGYWPTNPMPASAAIVGGAGRPAGDVGALVHGFLRAVWAEERDIAEDETVPRRSGRGAASIPGSPTAAC